MDEMPGADDNRRLYLAALSMIAMLFSTTMLYPGTLSGDEIWFGPVKINLVGMMLVISFPFIAAFLWQARKKISPGYLDLFIILTISYVTVRGLIAARQANETGLLIVAYAGYALVFYYGMAVLGQWWSSIKTLFMITIAIGVIVAGYALVEYYATSNFLFEGIIEGRVPEPGWGYHRSGSSLGHPVVLGLFLVQIAPLFIVCYYRARGRMARIAWMASIILLALALEVTFTRGAWITASILAAAGISWALWRHRELRRTTVMLVIAVGLSILLFTVFNAETVSSGTFSKARRHESVTPRLYMWSKTPGVFLENPLFGAGMMRGVDEIYRLEAPPEKWTNPPSAIDNLYLMMLVEQGILGSLLAGAALVLIVRQGIRLIRSGAAYGAVALILGISMSAVFIDGFTFDTMLNWPNMVIFWMSAGLLRALAELKKRDSVILMEKTLDE